MVSYRYKSAEHSIKGIDEDTYNINNKIKTRHTSFNQMNAIKEDNGTSDEVTLPSHNLEARKKETNQGRVNSELSRVTRLGITTCSGSVFH